jgi:polyisoprenoid-binding protein YceI
MIESERKKSYTAGETTKKVQSIAFTNFLKILESPDFLDAENHKEITFESTSIERTDDDNYKLKGLLTIKGVSKEVQLDAEHGGTSKDPWGNEKAGYSVTGKINRKDWGLNWNAALETGGVLVSDEVKINAEVQFVKQS